VAFAFVCLVCSLHNTLENEGLGRHMGHSSKEGRIQTAMQRVASQIVQQG
jgi:hypothetical protein